MLGIEIRSDRSR